MRDIERILATVDVSLGCFLLGWKRWGCGDLGNNEVFIITYVSQAL